MGKKDKSRHHGKDQKGAGPADPPSRDIDRTTLATRLNSAAVHLLRRLAREDGATGVSGPRLSALSVLVYGGPQSLRGLSDAEGVTPPSMTRLVAALEEEGLAERTRSPVDGRKVVIRATPAGEALMREGRDRRVEALAGWLGSVSGSELQRLDESVALLERMAASARPRATRA